MKKNDKIKKHNMLRLITNSNIITAHFFIIHSTVNSDFLPSTQFGITK